MLRENPADILENIRSTHWPGIRDRSKGTRSLPREGLMRPHPWVLGVCTPHDHMVRGHHLDTNGLLCDPSRDIRATGRESLIPHQQQRPKTKAPSQDNRPNPQMG